MSLNQDAPQFQRQATKASFDEARRKNKAKKVRVSGLYSYNVFDHPDYIRSKKIEKKLVRMRAKLSSNS